MALRLSLCGLLFFIPIPILGIATDVIAWSGREQSGALFAILFAAYSIIALLGVGFASNQTLRGIFPFAVILTLAAFGLAVGYYGTGVGMIMHTIHERFALRETRLENAVSGAATSLLIGGILADLIRLYAQKLTRHQPLINNARASNH